MCDLAVTVSATAFKLVEEVRKDLIFSGGARDEILVLTHVVETGDILNSENTWMVFVHHNERFLNHVLATIGELISQSTHELFKRDPSILIDIVVFHQCL